MILIIDHFDSFSHNLYQLFSTLHESVEVRRCDEVSEGEVLALNPDVLVLSPGPGGPKDTGVSLPLLKRQEMKAIPTVGVCLGFQVMADIWGAKVSQAKEVVHGKTLELKFKKHEIFERLGNTHTVSRYHSLGVKSASLPDHVNILAEHEGMAMMVLDKNLPWIGVQFHPESFLSPTGPEMTESILRYLQGFCRKHKDS